MSDEKEFQTVVLAALLHDIGKFLQRGKGLPFSIEGTHPEVSFQFVTAFAETFEKVADLELLKTLVKHHHRSRGYGSGAPSIEDIKESRARLLAYLINKADGLSASEREEHTAQWQDFKTVPMSSVFQRVFSAELQQPLNHYHPCALTTPDKLSDKILFPEVFDSYKDNEMNQSLQVFGKSASPLLKELGNDFNSLVNHLLTLLSTYTWAVPADTQEKYPDTSLFDHLKSTAAIASCLYQVYDSENAWEKAKQKQPGDVFCLLVGDISGIQRYVFDIASVERGGGGVAKRLRARSFFVQLISEIVPLQTLTAFHLPVANTIMASGGKFYILLPNLPSHNKLLLELQEKIDNWFMSKLKGELGLNLAWVSFGEEQMGKRFGEVISDVMSLLEKRKEQAFRQNLLNNGKWRTDSFILQPFGQNETACISCGKFASAEPEGFCVHCANDLKWGRLLPAVNYISIFPERNQDERELIGSGIMLTNSLDSFKQRPATLLQINNPDTLPAVKFPAAARYFVQHVPTDSNGDTLDFKQIAEKSPGRHYLGFLKADVDRLGEIIAFGLRGKENAIDGRRDTISRLSTLSRQLDLFFTGWVEHLLEAEFKDCYAVFSGGDDLFLTGPWNNIIEMATRLQQDFTQYTCHNPKITLSTGIVIAPHNYPISQAAIGAGKAVDTSKNEGRDRITLLEHTLTWAEWIKVKTEWEHLRGKRVSSAFLYSLLDYAQMWRKYKLWLGNNKDGDVSGLRFQPLLAYNLKRNVDFRKNPELYEWAKQLVDWRPRSLGHQ